MILPTDYHKTTLLLLLCKVKCYPSFFLQNSWQKHFVCSRKIQACTLCTPFWNTTPTIHHSKRFAYFLLLPRPVLGNEHGVLSQIPRSLWCFIQSLLYKPRVSHCPVLSATALLQSIRPCLRVPGVISPLWHRVSLRSAWYSGLGTSHAAHRRSISSCPRALHYL